MAETGQDDSFYARNPRVLNFTIMDNDQVPAVPLDITGLTVKWALSKKLEDGTFSTNPLLEKVTGAGITIINPIAGTVRVNIEVADTEGFSGEYYQELEVFSGPEGVVVATGTVTILKNVVNT